MDFVSPLSMTSWHYISEFLEQDGHQEAAAQCKTFRTAQKNNSRKLETKTVAVRSVHGAEYPIYAAVGRWCKRTAKKAFTHLRRTVNITKTTNTAAAPDKGFVVDREPIVEAMQMSEVKDLDWPVSSARNRKQSLVNPKEKTVCITLKERETPDDSIVEFDEKHC
ncbi:hypothetical protein S7711_10606 [Stachybotrys chartarum IBT 7711]|uniref:Uncharacterized protein n=1 Tax=Stachybotrys chartarum (strain CBS 109288 / IBT 7711) TaxID=1280523 RepID=A0A084AYY6_STACB|nr:hypothetical protein S7711_10606 [Stachybotrys chartarum IBT 7711]